MSPGAVAVALAVVGIVAIIWLISAYNTVVSLRGEAKRAWANIDVSLKRRCDLIPNLVSTVKGYAEHEKGVFEEIARLRASAMGAATQQARVSAENAIGRMMPSIFAYAEQYPALQANSNFLDLQRQLAQLESEIADRRELYNSAATNFNVYRQSFPAMLVARSMERSDMPLFDIAPQDRAVPTVSF